MGRRSKKPRKKYDPKAFAGPGKKPKKEKGWEGEDLFNEIARSKPHRR